MGPMSWRELPEPDDFDPEADLTPKILQALNSAHPADTIGDEWPWMRDKEATDNFVALAIPLQNAGSSDLETLVERFAYVIAAYWADERDRRSNWRARMFGWLRRVRP